MEETVLNLEQRGKSTNSFSNVLKKEVYIALKVFKVV